MAIEAIGVEWVDVGEGEKMGTFVGKVEATKSAAKPSGKKIPNELLSKPLGQNDFAEIGDGVVASNKVDLDADLYSDPDFLAVSGHLDRDGLEDGASEAALVEGIDVDPVANVVRDLNGKIGVNAFLDVVDDVNGKVNDVSEGGRWLAEHDPEHEPTVAVSRAAYRIALAIAQKIVGMGSDGRVKGLSGKSKGATVANETMDGAAASM